MGKSLRLGFAGATLAAVLVVAARAVVVANGIPVDPNQFSWQVAVRSEAEGKIKDCGGILVGRQWVLTAAHCVDFARSDDYTEVRVIAPHRLTVTGASVRFGGGLQLSVDPRYLPRVHPRWKANPDTPLAFDAALIKLATPAPETLRSAPLAVGAIESGRAVVSGWGAYNISERQSEELLAAEVVLMSNGQCVAELQAAQADYLVNDAVLCAGAIYYDACSGDSGGPLVAGPIDRPLTVGVVSWGPGTACTETPRGASQLVGGYTRASAIARWVRSATGDGRVLSDEAPGETFQVLDYAIFGEGN